MSSEIAKKLDTDGFIKINRYLPSGTSIGAFSELGTIVQLPGVAPGTRVDASSND